MAEGRQRGVEADGAARQRPALAAPGWCWTQRPPPSSSEPGTKVASACHSVGAGAHIACGSGRMTRDRAIALELAAVAAVDQPPVLPGLGDQGLQFAHAARTAGTPIVARAARAGDHPRARRADVVERHGEQRVDDLRRVDQAAVDGQLPGDVMGLAPGRFERHQQAGPRLRPHPVELALGDRRGGLGDDLLDQRERRRRLAARRRGVDVEQAGVVIGMQGRADRIGQPAVLADLLEQPRRRAAADHVGEQARGIIIGRGVARRREGQGQLRLLARMAADGASPPTKRAGSWPAAVPGREARRRCCLGQLHQLVMVDLAGGDQGHALPAIMRVAPVAEVVDARRRRWSIPRRGSSGPAPGPRRRPPTNRRTPCRSACRALRPAPGGRRPSPAPGRLRRNAARRIMSASSSTASGTCSAMTEAVKLVASRSVAALRSPPTSSIASLSSRARAAAGALEHHMLEQMGDAVQRRRLGARADLGEQADGGGLQAGHGMAGDPQARTRASSAASPSWLVLLPPALAERQRVDQRGDEGEQEPLDGIGKVVVGDRGGRRAACSPPGRRARSPTTSRMRLRLSGAMIPLTSPALPAGAGIGVLRPAEFDRHARPFGAAAAVGDMDEAGLARRDSRRRPSAARSRRRQWPVACRNKGRSSPIGMVGKAIGGSPWAAS